MCLSSGYLCCCGCSSGCWNVWCAYGFGFLCLCLCLLCFFFHLYTCKCIHLCSRSLGSWRTKIGVIVLTSLYFVFCIISQMMGSLREMTSVEVPVFWYISFSVPLSILNGIFAGWVGLALEHWLR
jgi:hypothetical protein